MGRACGKAGASGGRGSEKGDSIGKSSEWSCALQSDFLKHNLGYWSSRDPAVVRKIEAVQIGADLKVSQARNGLATLAAGEIQLHSSYDPAAEASKLATLALENTPPNSAILLIGLGLGYFARELHNRYGGEIAVVEADPAVVRAAFENADLSGLDRLRLIVGDNLGAALAALRPVADRAGGWDKLRVVEHAPSAKRNPSFCDGVRASIRGRAAMQSGGAPGVLVVTPMYGGSLPIARYCASAFERLGCRVETLDNSIFDDARKRLETISRHRSHRIQLEQALTALMSDMIVARALDRAVDLVWLVAQSPMSLPAAQELNRNGIPTAFWFVEEWQLLTYWQEWAPLFDYFFAIQRGPFMKALAGRGVKRAQYLPLAADPQVHKPLDLTTGERAEFGSEVSHVGAGYRNRRYLFSGLAGFDFKLWGSDWDDPGVLGKVLQRNGARISTDESVKIFNATSVNLNLHSSQFYDGVNPDGDYLNPRTFELAAAGAFQLVDFRKDLPDQFEPGREMVSFAESRELGPLIRYYLDHPAERQTIATAGRERVLLEHTYDLRMAQALDYIYGHETSRAGSRHPNHIDNLLKQAEGKPDLLELLAELRGKGVVTLDDVVERIRLREGDLSDAETIFLLLFEFRKWAAEKDLA